LKKKGRQKKAGKRGKRGKREKWKKRGKKGKRSVRNVAKRVGNLCIHLTLHIDERETACRGAKMCQQRNTVVEGNETNTGEKQVCKRMEIYQWGRSKGSREAPVEGSVMTVTDNT
jgi:hypothetical protein